MARPTADPAAEAQNGAVRPASATLAPSPPGRRRIYSEKSLYPMLSRLHAERAPGSWASAMQVTRACVEAQLRLDEAAQGIRSIKVVGDTTTEERQDARRRLQARCLDEPLGAYLNQFGPRTDDADAARFLAAMDDIRARSNAKKLQAAVEELARQGKLEEAEALPSNLVRWDGAVWPGGPYEFSNIIDAAIERATAEVGYERDDLRLMLKCYVRGDCSYQYGQLPKDFPAARRAQAEIVVEQMAEAIRSGDVPRFLGTKPGASASTRP